jgi:putative GTP pyrophosphokinase
MKSEKFKNQYASRFPLLERFRAALSIQLDELVKGNGLSLGVPIESRTKSLESISSKVERAGSTLISLDQINDLVGFRIILLFKKDLERVKKIISENFKVLKEEDTESRLGDDQFGYRSFHYQVKLKPEWVLVPSLSGLAEIVAEIQVRTVAQHIWAAASHELQYKKEASVPNAVKRSINRVSALLETVDLEFERLLDERQKYISSINVENTDQQLNVDLLAKYLDENLPPQNKSEEEGTKYSELLSELEERGITKLDELNNLWLKQKDAALQNDRETAVKVAANPKDPRYSKNVHAGAFFAHVGLIRIAMDNEFGSTFGYEIDDEEN